MKKSEQARIQSAIFEMVDRVKLHGRQQELVRIDLDITMNGQEAINYKVLKLFAPELPDDQFVKLLFLLGLKNATEIIKLIAPGHGIQL